MPRPCEACRHPERTTIDARLIAGETASALAPQYGLATASLYRHRDRHLVQPLQKVARFVRDATSVAPAPMELARIAPALATYTDVAERLGDIAEDLKETRGTAKAKGSSGILVAASREERGTLMDIAKLKGIVSDAPVTNIQVNNTVIVQDVAQRILARIQDPEARAAVAEAILAEAEESAA